MLESWKLGCTYSDEIFQTRLAKMAGYVIPEECLHGRMVDIGANLGCFTLAYGEGFNEVFCFEPCYENYLQLLKNAGDMPNVIAFPLALSNTAGPDSLGVHKSLDNGSCSLVSHEDWEGPFYPNCVIVTLSSLFDLWSPCSLMKIDCEGSEHQILMDLFSLPGGIEQSVKCLVIELHSQWPVESAELAEMLKRRFEVYHHHKSDHDVYTFVTKHPEWFE